MTLPSHLEAYLGEIDAGWQGSSSANVPFQVARFSKGSDEDSVSFASLGLSDHLLRGKSRQIRQELFMIVPKSLREGPVPGIIQQVGAEALEKHQALLRGDVIGARGPIFRNSQMEALYVTLPVYFPDEFAVYEQDDKAIAIAWLVPISANEANYVHKHGWSKFEELMERKNPDLVDIHRKPLEI